MYLTPGAPLGASRPTSAIPPAKRCCRLHSHRVHGPIAFGRLRIECCTREKACADLRIGLTGLAATIDSEKNSNSRTVRVREAIVAVDREVTAQYGWSDIRLDHGFHAVAYLPEGHNVRFTSLGSSAAGNPLQTRGSEPRAVRGGEVTRFVWRSNPSVIADTALAKTGRWRALSAQRARSAETPNERRQHIGDLLVRPSWPK